MKKRFHQRIVLILACIVTFCVTYALILPAITLSRQSNDKIEEVFSDAEKENLIVDGSESMEPQTEEEPEYVGDTDQGQNGTLSITASFFGMSAADFVRLYSSSQENFDNYYIEVRKITEFGSDIYVSCDSVQKLYLKSATTRENPRTFTWNIELPVTDGTQPIQYVVWEHFDAFTPASVNANIQSISIEILYGKVFV